MINLPLWTLKLSRTVYTSRLVSLGQQPRPNYVWHLYFALNISHTYCDLIKAYLPLLYPVIWKFLINSILNSKSLSPTVLSQKTSQFYCTVPVFTFPVMVNFALLPCISFSDKVSLQKFSWNLFFHEQEWLKSIISSGHS